MCLLYVVVMLQRLEEETHTNKYIVTEKLPKEMAQQRKILLNLQKVVAEPAMGQSDLDKLHEQVQHHMAVHHSTPQYTTEHHTHWIVTATHYTEHNTLLPLLFTLYYTTCCIVIALSFFFFFLKNKELLIVSLSIAALCQMLLNWIFEFPF